MDVDVDVNVSEVQPLLFQKNFPQISLDQPSDIVQINKSALHIFSQICTLEELKKSNVNELEKLESQKKDLEKTWTIYFYKNPGMYRIANVGAMGLVTVSGFSVILPIGMELTAAKISVGGTLMVLGVGMALFSDRVIRSPCIKSTINAYITALDSLNMLHKQREAMDSLIKATNVFTNFCNKFNSYVEKSSFKKAKNLYKILKELEDCDAIKKFVSRRFMMVAPLILLEKISKSSTGNIASDWDKLKNDPTSWGKVDIVPWKTVEYISPHSSTYPIFFQLTKSKLPIADPSNWQKLYNDNLKTCIEDIRNKEKDTQTFLI